MSSSRDPGQGEGTLGRIALKQVRMTRQEAAALAGGGSFDPGSASGSQGVGGVSGGSGGASGSGNGGNPANRLVPYLDLFSRLGDDELARLAGVTPPVVEQLRLQVDEVCRALGRYDDLLPRLRDEELARLTGASPKTVRFWRLCKMKPGDLDADGAPREAPRDATPVRGHDAGAGVPAPMAASSSSPQVVAAPVAARPAAVRPAAVAATAGVSGAPFPGAAPKGVPEPKADDEEDIFAGVFDDEEDEDAAGKDPLDITQDDDFF